MIKCPNCGSTAQVKYLKRTFEEDGDSICVIRKYQCGCGEIFHTTEYYYSDYPETVDEHVIWDD
jgi:hypothetical protein